MLRCHRFAPVQVKYAKGGRDTGLRPPVSRPMRVDDDDASGAEAPVEGSTGAPWRFP